MHNTTKVNLFGVRVPETEIEFERGIVAILRAFPKLQIFEPHFFGNGEPLITVNNDESLERARTFLCRLFSHFLAAKLNKINTSSNEMLTIKILTSFRK